MRQQQGGRQVPDLLQVKGRLPEMVTNGHRVKLAWGFGRVALYEGSQRSFCAQDFRERTEPHEVQVLP